MSNASEGGVDEAGVGGIEAGPSKESLTGVDGAGVNAVGGATEALSNASEGVEGAEGAGVAGIRVNVVGEGVRGGAERTVDVESEVGEVDGADGVESKGGDEGGEQV